jgi:LPXTG-motif cell wall-anchored protein
MTVTNTGTVTLQRVTISDSLLTRLHVSVTCAASKLAPGASTTCTSARFAVTRAQATAKVLRNQATATARTLSGDSVKSATSTASVAVQAPTSARPSRPTSPKPSTSTAVARLRMSQWVASVTDHDKDGRLDAGDAVTFGFRVANAGSLSVHDLRVVDRRLQRAGVSVHCPVSSLPPGASVVCMSGPVVVTAHQANAGFGRNFAYAIGRTSAGTAVRSNSSVTDVGRTARSAESAALPRTGSDLADPALLGLALLVGGATMTVVSRRRRPA